jgi:hypothetical protein
VKEDETGESCGTRGKGEKCLRSVGSLRQDNIKMAVTEIGGDDVS